MATSAVTNRRDSLSMRSFNPLCSANRALKAFSMASRPLIWWPVWSVNSPLGVQKPARALASALWNASTNASAFLNRASASLVLPAGVWADTSQGVAKQMSVHRTRNRNCRLFMDHSFRQSAGDWFWDEIGLNLMLFRRKALQLFRGDHSHEQLSVGEPRIPAAVFPVKDLV